MDENGVIWVAGSAIAAVVVGVVGAVTNLFARTRSLEREVAVLKARETADYNRLSGIEARLKALETCQSGMKADLAAIRAILEARPGKTPTPGSK